jgi:alpha-tubulin suppressor-like RCC1 family protein
MSIFKDLGFKQRDGKILSPDTEKLGGKTLMDIRDDFANTYYSAMGGYLTEKIDSDGSGVLSVSYDSYVKRVNIRLDAQESYNYAAMNMRFLDENSEYISITNPDIEHDSMHAVLDKATIATSSNSYDNRYYIAHLIDTSKNFDNPTYNYSDYYLTNANGGTADIEIVFNEPIKISSIIFNLCPEGTARQTDAYVTIYDAEDNNIGQYDLKSKSETNYKETIVLENKKAPIVSSTISEYNHDFGTQTYSSYYNTGVKYNETDMDIEFDFNCQSIGEYNVFLRDNDNYWSLRLRAGKLSFAKYDGSWQHTDFEFQAEENVTYSLKAEFRGDFLTYYIDGVNIGTKYLPRSTSSGYVYISEDSVDSSTTVTNVKFDKKTMSSTQGDLFFSKTLTKDSGSWDAYKLSAKGLNGDLVVNGYLQTIESMKVNTEVKDLKVSPYGEHALLLLDNGDVYGIGDGSTYGFGKSGTHDLTEWTKVAEGAKKIFVGHDSSAYIDENDTPYFSGTNSYTMFGTTGGDTSWVTPNGTASNIAFDMTSTTLKIDVYGNPFGAGRNNDGQIGDTSTTTRTSFVSSDDRTPSIIQVESLYSSFLVLYSDGVVCGSGSNQNYRLGVIDNTNDVTDLTTETLTNVKLIRTGRDHSFALKEDGTLWATGYSPQYALGSNTINFNGWTKISEINGEIEDIQTSYYGTIITMIDGSVYVAGTNTHKFLSQEHTDGEVIKNFTKVDYSNINRVLNMAKYMPVTYVLTTSGEIKGIGYNNYGVLPTGNTSNVIEYANVYSPTEITYDYDFNMQSIDSNSITIDVEGIVGTIIFRTYIKTYEEYENDIDGLLSISGDSLNDIVTISQESDQPNWRRHRTTATSFVSDTPTVLVNGELLTIDEVLNTDEKVVQVETSYYNSFMVTSEGRLFGTGRNNYNQLGSVYSTNDQMTFVELTDISGVEMIASGFYHTIALMEDGTVKGVGYNGYGQMGLGNSTSLTQWTDLGLENIEFVTCGYYNTYVIDKSGVIYVTGDNGNGQLGINNTTRQYTWTVSTPNSSKRPIKISANQQSALVLCEDGYVYGAGYNNYRQLGDGSTTQRQYWIQTKTDAIDISLGKTSFSLYVDDSNRAKFVGDNPDGQAGRGNTTDLTTYNYMGNYENTVKVFAGYDCSIILKDDGTIWVAGENTYRQLGMGNTSSDVTTTTQVTDVSMIKSVSVFRYQAIILMEDGTVKVCGYNSYGCLGLGTNNSYTYNFTVPTMPTLESVYKTVFKEKFINSSTLTVQTVGDIENLDIELSV